MSSKDIETATAPVDHLEVLPSKVAEHADQGDTELNQYANGPAVEISPEENKRLFWKINRRILVIMLITYFCQSLDKGTLNFASIMNITEDAHLVGQQYNWLGTILYMGILAGEYPMNFLLQKFPVAKLLAANVFVWGAIVSCSAASTNFASLMTVRFLLGFFESCVQPAMMLLVSMWYKREEQPVLNSLWYCMTGLQLMVGGLLAFGVSHYEHHNIKSWQLLFLVLGLFTVAWSFCIGIFLPDSPMKAKCYSEDEKRLMVERVRANETGIQNRKYKKYQVMEAISDPFVWLCVAMILVANLVIGGLGVFSNLIISAFGFSLLQTELLNIAQGAWTIAVMVGSAWLCQRTKQNCWVMVAWTIPAIAGTIAILTVEPTPGNSGGMLIAFYCTQFILAEGNMIISLITRNIAGQTKKGVCMAMTFIGWAVGNMVAPQIFQTSDAPRYLHGFVAHICIYAVFLLLVIATRILLMRRNAQKVAGMAAATGDGEKVSHDLSFADLTDRENPNFRYVY